MFPRTKLINDKASRYLIQMIYVETFTYLKKKLGSPKILEEKLYQMGVKISKDIFNYYKTNKSTITGIIQDVIKKIADIKKLKIVKQFSDDEKGFLVTFEKCPLCISEVEEEDVHYCTTTMSIMEEYLNLCINDGKIKNYKKVKGKVVKSVSNGDKVCEYYFQLIE